MLFSIRSCRHGFFSFILQEVGGQRQLTQTARPLNDEIGGDLEPSLYLNNLLHHSKNIILCADYKSSKSDHEKGLAGIACAMTCPTLQTFMKTNWLLCLCPQKSTTGLSCGQRSSSYDNDFPNPQGRTDMYNTPGIIAGRNIVVQDWLWSLLPLNKPDDPCRPTVTIVCGGGHTCRSYASAHLMPAYMPNPVRSILYRGQLGVYCIITLLRCLDSLSSFIAFAKVSTFEASLAFLFSFSLKSPCVCLSYDRRNGQFSWWFMLTAVLCCKRPVR